MFKTYILINKAHNKTYVGITADINKRLAEHNSGKSAFTSRYGPWTVFHIEEYPSIAEARKREKYYKSCAGRKKIKKMFSCCPVV